MFALSLFDHLSTCIVGLLYYWFSGIYALALIALLYAFYGFFLVVLPLPSLFVWLLLLSYVSCSLLVVIACRIVVPMLVLALFVGFSNIFVCFGAVLFISCLFSVRFLFISVRTLFILLLLFNCFCCLSLILVNLSCFHTFMFTIDCAI